MKSRQLNIFFALFSALLFGGCAMQNNNKSHARVDNPEEVFQNAVRYYKAERWGKASRNFEKIMVDYIGHPREDSLIFFNARCKFKDNDYGSASTYFEMYRRQFSRSPLLEDAEGMLILCYYFSAPDHKRDPTNTYQTLSSIEEFKSRYPRSEKLADFEEIRKELVQRLHDRSYTGAYTYYKTGKYKAAIAAFKLSLKEYPETNNREKIMYYMVLSGYELARNSIASLIIDRYLAVVDMYYSFIAEFPDSKYRKDLDGVLSKAKEFLEKSDPELLKAQELEERPIHGDKQQQQQHSRNK